MIQKLYQDAMKYAGVKHCDQLVPGTKSNYLLHISNVSMEILMAHKELPTFDLEYAIQVAILHDTLEDTDATYDDIKKLFGMDVANGVQSLTKNDSLPTKILKMEDSIKRIRQQQMEVALVKLADRITNLQEPPAHWTIEKRNKYLQEARSIAITLQGHHSYLDQRIKRKIDQYVQYCQES